MFDTLIGILKVPYQALPSILLGDNEIPRAAPSLLCSERNWFDGTLNGFSMEKGFCFRDSSPVMESSVDISDAISEMNSPLSVLNSSKSQWAQ